MGEERKRMGGMAGLWCGDAEVIQTRSSRPKIEPRELSPGHKMALVEHSFLPTPARTSPNGNKCSTTAYDPGPALARMHLSQLFHGPGQKAAITATTTYFLSHFQSLWAWDYLRPEAHQ